MPGVFAADLSTMKSNVLVGSISSKVSPAKRYRVFVALKKMRVGMTMYPSIGPTLG